MQMDLRLMFIQVVQYSSELAHLVRVSDDVVPEL